VNPVPAPPTHFERELREQPAVLERLLREGEAAARAIAAAVARRGARFAVLAARGSSDNAARYGQYLFGVRNRLVAALATPSVFTHYGAEPDLSSALVVGVSQSGQSPDVIEVLASGRRQGALSVALTNEPGSPLAAAAEFVLPLLAGEEIAVAATKTYTAQALALAMLSAALAEDAAAWDELRALPEQVQATLDRNSGAALQAQAFADFARLVVVGRGYNLATVGEIALKVKETSGVMADDYSSADFLHGPQAVLAGAVPLLAVAPGPRVFDDLERACRLARERGVPLIVLSDRAELLDAADARLELPTVPEWLSPLVAVVPGQLWALGLSLARGRQPDAPPGLAKVTHTF
jgi:glucosamine--fructose-6-phosphate aminotransferase (isomerizing)